EATGDIAFWRKHVAQFTGPKTYALVIEMLLDKRDYTAAMALLMQWLGRCGELPLVEGEFSFHILALRWLNEVLNPKDDAASSSKQQWDLVGKFFDYLEANADEHWSAPRFELKTGSPRKRSKPKHEEELFDEPPDDNESAERGDDEDDVFGAAYENVVYRDST